MKVFVYVCHIIICRCPSPLLVSAWAEIHQTQISQLRYLQHFYIVPTLWTVISSILGAMGTPSPYQFLKRFFYVVVF
jgi:hypothetical protein